MLQKVKSTLHRDLVLYNEDHHPNHIVCFCPRFFSSWALHTWDDPSVFKSLEGSAEEWRPKMLDQIPAHLSRRYSWSFSKSAPLPRGTVFLKRKKQFAKGRTIISYSQVLVHKLLEMASVALTLVAKRLYSDSPGMQSMPQLWESLHKHWARPSTDDDVEWNDDFVGFSVQCPARTSCNRYKPSSANTISSRAALFARSICCPRQDTREIPGEGQSPTSNDAGSLTSQPSWSCLFQLECSRRPESVVSRSRGPASETGFPPSFQACRCSWRRESFSSLCQQLCFPPFCFSDM